MIEGDVTEAVKREIQLHCIYSSFYVSQETMPPHPCDQLGCSCCGNNDFSENYTSNELYGETDRFLTFIFFI
jgi:hypothetical protein